MVSDWLHRHFLSDLDSTRGSSDVMRRFVEMGAGSGWLAYLLREKGAHVDAFDAMEGGTFVGV